MVNQGERERPEGEGGIDPKRYPQITAMRRRKEEQDAARGKEAARQDESSS